LERDITIGVFSALITSIGTTLDNADALYGSLQNLRWHYRMVKHYYKFMGLREISAFEGTPNLNCPRIEFDNVWFSYPGTDVPILKGIRFTVDPGKHVAIVGENGAGKSTIIKLLCRLYKPDSGRILVNGYDIQTLDPQVLHKVFAVVFQDYCKYSFTLRENVAFGDISKIKDDSALKKALKMGLVDDVKDLDIRLGKLEEDGVDLSGGQWQRIAIARACLPESEFVILDEPTASLDPIAESKMYVSFFKVLKNRGSIIISHRLAIARMADKIIVLSNGIVSESGSHTELMNANGLYAEMYRAQSSWYVSDKKGDHTA